jgi:cysteinyl-tRNA synthetase
MEQELFLYNTRNRKKEAFKPLNPPFVGMYVCGPTVYGDAHLGHARPAITYDILFRYLKVLGYSVRYVRNITDVGHLENDADEGEDKIAKKARLESLEPMEIVQRYTNNYHNNMNQLNVLNPSIEPTATGHIIEQQQLVREIQEKGYAYEKNGSVYFDVEKYSKDHQYGKLSGRKLEDMLSETRTLKGQEEKKNSFDFALWKKANPEHIMKWPSQWSNGYPGWHLECSVMSTKYLGKEFDIHGGGMDLLFPHHECEMAQSVAANGQESVRYWIHNNMITINGQKMAKSLGNFITLDQLFSGEHDLLTKAYPPMTVRFFILQAHYRSTLDFSNEALEAAEKGFDRLMKSIETLENLNVSDKSTVNIDSLIQQCYEAINDDLNTPVLIANLFDGVKIINSINDGTESISKEDHKKLMKHYNSFVFDILGLQQTQTGGASEVTDALINKILQIRVEAKKAKNFDVADKIRNELTSMGIVIKDTKEGFEWEWA